LRRPVARASRLASSNGQGLAALGALGLAWSALAFDPLGLVVAGLVLFVGVAEMRAGKALKHGDRTAPRRLARGELALMAGLLVYCGIQLARGPQELAALEQELGGRDLGIDLVGLGGSVHRLLYALVAGATLLYQGGLARYFHTRGKPLEAYLAGSPQWAREVLAEL